MLAWPIMSLVIHLKDFRSALATLYDLFLYVGFVLLVFLGTGRFVRLLLKRFGSGSQFSDSVGGIIAVWFIGMIFVADMIAVNVIVTAYMLGCAMPRDGPTIKVRLQRSCARAQTNDRCSKTKIMQGLVIESKVHHRQSARADLLRIEWRQMQGVSTECFGC